MLDDVIVIINILITITCCSIKDFDNDVIAKAYNNVTTVYINVNSIIKRFIKDDNDAYFIMKVYNKRFDDGVIIARLSNSENVMITKFISVLYFCIRFIALFKYLTLY